MAEEIDILKGERENNRQLKETLAFLEEQT
jgi:hypothetical protein